MNDTLTMQWEVFYVLWALIMIVGEYHIFKDAETPSRKEFYGNNILLFLISGTVSMIFTTIISGLIEVSIAFPKKFLYAIAIVIGALIVKEILYQIYKKMVINDGRA